MFKILLSWAPGRHPKPKAGALLCCHQVSGSPSTFSWKPAEGCTAPEFWCFSINPDASQRQPDLLLFG